MHTLFELYCHASFALCCCELQVLQALFADRQHFLPASSKSSADGFILCRWPHPIAGGNSTQPVVSLSVLRGIPETLAVFRGAKQGKQRQTMHGSAIPSKSRACAASDPLPEGFTVLIRLINLFS